MFDDDFLRRIREQQEQMRRLFEPLDVSQYTSIADQVRTAVEQLRASGIFSSLESSTVDLRAVIGSSASVDLAAQKIRDLYGPDSVTRRMGELLGVSSNAALNLPLYDLPRQLQASAAFTEMASLRLHTVDPAHVGSLISAPNLSRARIGKTTALLARRHGALGIDSRNGAEASGVCCGTAIDRSVRAVGSCGSMTTFAKSACNSSPLGMRSVGCSRCRRSVPKSRGNSPTLCRRCTSESSALVLSFQQSRTSTVVLRAKRGHQGTAREPMMR